MQKKAAERKQVDDSIAVGKALSIKKLSNWKELEDDEIRKTINAIEEELKDQKYEPGFFQQIILTFFSFISTFRIIFLYNRNIHVLKFGMIINC